VQPQSKPKWKPKNDEIVLDVDMGSVLAKFNVQVSIKEMAKLPPHRNQIKKALGLDDEPNGPPVILKNVYLNKRNEGHYPFLLSIVIDKLILHNCMLDSRASANVMHQLELGKCHAPTRVGHH